MNALFGTSVASVPGHEWPGKKRARQERGRTKKALPKIGLPRVSFLSNFNPRLAPSFMAGVRNGGKFRDVHQPDHSWSGQGSIGPREDRVLEGVGQEMPSSDFNARLARP